MGTSQGLHNIVVGSRNGTTKKSLPFQHNCGQDFFDKQLPLHGSQDFPSRCNAELLGLCWLWSC